MPKIPGVDVLVKVDINGTPTIIGGQSGATLNRSKETIDATSKDSNGWVENLAGIKSWSVECEGFIVDDDVALHYLEDAFMNDQIVTVEIAMPSGKKYQGQALVTEIPFEFPQDDASTFSITLEGTGPLTEVTG